MLIDSRKAYQKEWRRNNPEKVRISREKWAKNNRECIRISSKNYAKAHPEKIKAKTLKKFGISVDEYKKMFLRQGGLCAICRKKNNPLIKKELAVDHSHKNGCIRGLLCNKCNRGLGLLGDDLSILENAVLYLKKTLEPQKTFRKVGITNGDDILTEDGQKVFLAWLLNTKFADDFKKDVADEMLKDLEEKK